LATLWYSSFRTLFFGICFHYVDDYGGIEPATLADSAFKAFFEFSEILGFETKLSKEQPPSSRQVMLGVNSLVTEKNFITEILETRKRRMLTEIKDMLEKKIVNKKQAQTLAGKSVFTNASTFGALGAAALRPLYRRATYGGTEIDTDIDAALHMLSYLLEFAPPRWTPLAPPAGETPILYADAFFTSRGETTKISDFSEKNGFFGPSRDKRMGCSRRTRK